MHVCKTNNWPKYPFDELKRKNKQYYWKQLFIQGNQWIKTGEVKNIRRTFVYITAIWK